MHRPKVGLTSLAATYPALRTPTAERRSPVFQLSQIRERMAFPVPFYPVSPRLERAEQATDRPRGDVSASAQAAELDARLLDGVAAGDADALALLFDRHGAA